MEGGREGGREEEREGGRKRGREGEVFRGGKEPYLLISSCSSFHIGKNNMQER